MCQVTTLSAYLDCVLKSYAMSHLPKEVAYNGSKRDQVQKHLEQQYAAKLARKKDGVNPANIFLSGSVAKSTEINIRYDVDLIMPLQHKSDGTLEEMLTDLNTVLTAYQKTNAELLTVRKQKVSVGMTFKNAEGTSINMDIVPGREKSLGNYASEGFLNLYNSDTEKQFQTNIKKQNEAICNSDNNVRHIIRLLKVWKFHGSRKAVKSFMLELLAIRAFANAAEKTPSDLWGKLKMVMEFIRDYIETIALVDPGNSSNKVSNLLTSEQKTEIVNNMRNMLNSIAANPENIKTYFPCNVTYCK